MKVYKHKSTKKRTLRDFFNFSIFPKGKHFIKKEKNKHKSNFFKFFGVFVGVVLGFSFWVVFSLKPDLFGVCNKEVCNKIESFEYYDSLIWPIVLEDPPCFNEKKPLDEKIKIKSAIWDTAMNSKDKTPDYDENDMIIFPASEVQKSYEKLFGKEFNCDYLEDINDSLYKFSKAKKEFYVKAVSGTDQFFPHTVDAFWEKNNLILKVEYIVSQDQFDENMNVITEVKPEKFANYVLKKNKKTGNLYVCSVF